MRVISCKIIYGVLLCMLVGCGYRFQDAEKITISVPFVEGDYDGQLTNEIVQALATSGMYEYRQSSGRYVLQVAIKDDVQDKVGYQYDRKEFSGKRLKNLQPSENRRSIAAEVALFDPFSQKTIVGPVIVKADSDFDYIDIYSLKDLAVVAPDGKTDSVVNLSQGQLDSIEGGQDAAVLVVYRRLAQKIVAGLYKQHSLSS